MADLASLGRKQFTIYDTWPFRLGQSVLDAVKTPGDILNGHFATTPATPGTWSEEDEWRAQRAHDEMSRRAFDFASTFAGGSAISAARRMVPRARGRSGVIENVVVQDAKRPPAYDPPSKSQRPFEADYPFGAAADQSGKLRADIEGRRLFSDHVAGRRTPGGPDQPLTPAEIEAVAAKLGLPFKELPARDMGGNYGFSLFDRPRNARALAILKSASPAVKARAKAHELGHLLDDLGGATVARDEYGALRAIPQEGLNGELRNVYHTLKTGKEPKPPLFGPEQRGYPSDEVASELMAEAIRAYMTNPNYLKTVAPKTAARIRMYLNLNPALNGAVQFNTFAGAGLTGAALANGGLSSGEQRREGAVGGEPEFW